MRPPGGAYRFQTGNNRKRNRLFAKNSVLVIGLIALLALAVLVIPEAWTQANLPVLPPNVQVASGVSEALPLRISEVMSSNQRALIDDRAQYPDWIEVENTSESPIDLGGVGLSDKSDRVLFIFPSQELAPHAQVIVFCDKTNQATAGMALHAQFGISAMGETVYLFDRNAVVMDTVDVPALGADMSYARTAGGAFETTGRFTPGYSNTEAGHTAFLQLSINTESGLVINEVAASNRTVAADEDGDYSDWLELYNSGSLAIDLHQYQLSNNPARLDKWRFPSGAVIQPGEYYLVFASGKNRTGGAGTHPHTGFKLSSKGDTVILSDIRGQRVDQVSYDAIEKDSSLGRVRGMEDVWQVYQNPTPGLSNDLEGELTMNASWLSQNRTGIFISEVMLTSTGADTPYGNTSYDWIEICNRGSEPVNLKGWGLSDKPGRPRKWQFPDVSLAPGGHILVFASGLGESPVGSGALHSTFRLSAIGQTITLCEPDGHVVDKLVVPTMEADIAYGRDFGSGALLYFETPTASAENTSGGYIGYAEKPIIEKAGGLFSSAVTVTISAPSGIRIRYTTDGSEPTLSIGEDYTGPITVSTATCIRARGFVDGLMPSRVVTETYLINKYHILPVVSLTVDPDDLWNPLTGIYADGFEETFVETPFKNTTYYLMNKDKLLRERAGNFEYFTPEGVQVVNESVAVQLHGNYSLDIAQKSFRVTAKAKYGSTALSYPFFDERPYDAFRALILRNGGNDGSYTRIVDSLISEIVDWTGSDIIHMASTPVIVYLNGQYWGQYDIRERVNKYYAAMYENWDDPKGMDYIKGDREVLNGTFSNYRSLLDYVKKHDLNDPEALKTVLDWIDVDNYFDFMIFQTYFGNTDTMNIKFYRQNVEGAKWRWVFFDIDWGYFNRDTNGFRAWLKPEGTGQKLGDNTLIRALLKVPEMRDKFLSRYGYLYQTYLTDTDRIIALVDEMVATIEPELALHFTRWAGETKPAVAIDPYNARDNAAAYWKSRVNRLKNTISARPHHVWKFAQEWFELTDEQMLHYFGPQPEEGENLY